MSQKQRSPLHVVFLVDTAIPAGQDVESHFASLKLTISRIILFFVTHIDARTTWSHRSFNSTKPSIAMSNYRFKKITRESVDMFLAEYRQRVELDRDTSNNPSLYKLVRNTLIQSLAEFHWTDIDYMDQTPRHYNENRNTTDVKNFMFLATPFPHQWATMESYLQDTPMSPIRTPADKSTVAEIVSFFCTDLRKWLMKDFFENRISLSIIDFTRNTGQSTDQDLTHLCEGMDTMLKSFAGTFFHVDNICTDFSECGESFNAFFIKHYCSQLYMSSDKAHCDSILNSIMKPPVVDPFWSGKLFFSPDELDSAIDLTAYHCQNLCTLTSLPPHTEQFQSIVGLSVVRCIPRLFLNPTWTFPNSSSNGLAGIPSLFLSAKDPMDGRMCKLNQKLWERQQVCVVTMTYPNNTDTSSERTPLFGILESYATSSAILTILGDGFDATCLDAIPCEADQRIPFSPLGNALFDPTNPEFASYGIRHWSEFTDFETKSNTSQSLKRKIDSPDYLEKLCAEVSERKRQRKQMAAYRIKASQEPPAPVTPCEEIAEPVWPSTLSELSTSLNSLYYDSLYTNRYTLLSVMEIVTKSIAHLLPDYNNDLCQEIIAILKNKICTSGDFIKKYENTMPVIPEDSEDHALFSVWLANVQSEKDLMKDYEMLSLKALRGREAKLQMIWYLAMFSLLRRIEPGHDECIEEGTERLSRSSPNPKDQLMIFASLTLLWEGLNNLEKFLIEADSRRKDDNGKELDKADLSMEAFSEDLEKIFLPLVPNWMRYFREKCIDDEFTYDETPFPINVTAKAPTPAPVTKKLPTKKPVKGYMQDYVAIDNSKNAKSKYESKNHKTFVPQHNSQLSQKSSQSSQKARSVKPQKSFSIVEEHDGRPLPNLPFLRRQIDLEPKVVSGKRKVGEAAAAAIAKVERAKINGVPTMVRAGAFMKSARSFEWPAESKSQGESTKSTVLRVREPLSPTTPRTRMARDYGIDFSCYSSSPNRDKSPDLDDLDDLDMDPFADELPAPTETSTPRRMKRLMMNTTPSHGGRMTTPFRPMQNLTSRNLAESLREASSSQDPVYAPVESNAFSQIFEDDGDFGAGVEWPTMDDMSDSDDESHNGSQGRLSDYDM